MTSIAPPLGNIAVLLILAVILIIFSMLFSASESAFFCINKLRIRFLRSKNHKGAMRAGKLLDNRDRLLNTVLVGNNIVNIALSAILTSIALGLFGPAGVGYATITTTILLLIFGEITPKTLGTQHPETIAFKLSPFLLFFGVLFHPLVVFFSIISRGIARLFGINLTAQKVSFTEEEIKTLIEVGEEEGVLEADEKNMMHSVFAFNDLEAKDIMVPRTEIISIGFNASYTDVLELSQKSRLSRFPVLGKDIDDIKGILYIKDVLLYIGAKKDFSVKKIMRAPLFVLETKNMSSIQQLFREKTQSIAIVLDEYSGIAGLLTNEDMSREIFGTLNDEYDIPTDISQMEKSNSLSTRSGKTRLTDISLSFKINLHSEYNETISGFIMEKLDRVPHEGDFIIVENCRITVKSVRGRRITEVDIKEEEV